MFMFFFRPHTAPTRSQSNLGSHPNTTQTPTLDILEFRVTAERLSSKKREPLLQVIFRTFEHGDQDPSSELL